MRLDSWGRNGGLSVTEIAQETSESARHLFVVKSSACSRSSWPIERWPRANSCRFLGTAVSEISVTRVCTSLQHTEEELVDILKL